MDLIKNVFHTKSSLNMCRTLLGRGIRLRFFCREIAGPTAVRIYDLLHLGSGVDIVRI